MTRDQTVYAAYCLAEALNDPAMRAKLTKYYGTFGVVHAKNAILAMCDEVKISAPEIDPN